MNEPLPNPDTAQEPKQEPTPQTDPAPNPPAPEPSGESIEERVERLAQSKADKLLANYGKKNADLQRKLNELRKASLSDAELKSLELEEKQKELADKEKALRDRENQLIALKALKAAELDSGDDKVLELVPLVIGEDEQTINTNVAALKAAVEALAARRVDAAIKGAGRIPGGGTQTEPTKDPGTEKARQLGKKRAEARDRANNILDYYLRRN